MENEREQIRQARERERLAEEERLKKQREIEKQAVATSMNTEPVLTSPSQKSPPNNKSSQRIPPTHIDIEPDEPQLPEYGRAKYSFHPQGQG